jgi:hypothetical protein
MRPFLVLASLIKAARGGRLSIAGVLIGVVVALAPIDVFRAHAIFFVHPTEVGEVGVIEGVSIFDCPGVNESQVGIDDNAIKLFLRERRADYVHWQFGGRKESDVAPKDLWGWPQFQGERQRLPVYQYGLAGFGQCDVISGRLTKIPSCKNEMLLLNIAEIIDPARDEPYVSSQLFLFRVPGYPSLVAGGAESQRREGDGEYFKPRVLSFFSAFFVWWGLWLGICGRWSGRWWLSAGLVAVGWLGQLNYPLINYL